MIKDCYPTWKEIFTVNEPTFELLYLKKNIPIIIAKNVLKYPEKVKEFLSDGYWWPNGLSEEFARPGKSFAFGGNERLYLDPLLYYFEQLFGLKYIEVLEIVGNCFNGDMEMFNSRSAFPHVDSWFHDRTFDLYMDNKKDSPGPLDGGLIAYNLNITDDKNVKTGFWSFRDKTSIFNFNRIDFNEYETYNMDMDKKYENEKNLKWFQIEGNSGPFKLEDVFTLEYNSLVLYPTFHFHKPYLKEEWFTDSDRVTITGFLGIDPNEMSFPKESFNNVRSVWELFGLNDIFGLNQ